VSDSKIDMYMDRIEKYIGEKEKRRKGEKEKRRKGESAHYPPPQSIYLSSPNTESEMEMDEP
jgi:hypothetical protein